MGFEPGHPKFGGRQKGTPNKSTTAARKLALATLGDLGEYAANARAHPGRQGAAAGDEIARIPLWATAARRGPRSAPGCARSAGRARGGL